MKKILMILAVISLFGLRWPSNSQAAGPELQWGRVGAEMDLLGVVVYNPAGERLGIVSALVNDSEGHPVFAILWQGDTNSTRYVAVPFSTLSIYENQSNQTMMVLNADKRALDSLPGLDRTGDLNNVDFASSIYRTFGQVPYWTEEGGNAGPEINSPGVTYPR